MAIETILLSGLGTLVIALGYVLLKRFRRSRCQSHTACCDCESPEIKLQHENTQRLDHIMNLINQIQPKSEGQESPISLGEGGPAISAKATTSSSRACDNPGDNLTCPLPARVGSHDIV